MDMWVVQKSSPAVVDGGKLRSLARHCSEREREPRDGEQQQQPRPDTKDAEQLMQEGATPMYEGSEVVELQTNDATQLT